MVNDLDRDGADFKLLQLCEFRFIPGGLCFNALVPPGNAAQRKLAAIMFTDMVGYSALAQRDSLDNVKGDPRWDAFLRKMGLADDQLK